MWDECQVTLNACVIKFYHQKKQAFDYIVLATTDSGLNATWLVRHYEERPEIEQDYQQMKSGGWQLQKLSSTKLQRDRVVRLECGHELQPLSIIRQHASRESLRQ